MEQTSLEELKRTAASGAYRRIPIWREIFQISQHPYRY